MIFTDNKNFYPTPPELAQRMYSKLKNKYPDRVLEPSAGKGDLLDGMFPVGYHRHRPEFYCIENDPTLQATLRGKGFNLLDSDFLAYSGWDKFPLIAGNPPFDHGDKHLIKAIHVMYKGEIVFLLNAETIRNPHTNTRKDLLSLLEQHNADIEFIEGAFVSAERPTGVEIALIHIEMNRDEMGGLFDDITDAPEAFAAQIKDKHEIATGRTIEELVATFNETVQLCIDTAIAFYRNYHKVGGYLGLATTGELTERYPNLHRTGKERTDLLQDLVNKTLIQIRRDFWRKVLDVKEVNSRMTVERQKEFENTLSSQEVMDFTESNIRQFVLNVIGSYESVLRKAVDEVFDRMTIKHAYHGGVHEKNVHFFSGWRRNNSFQVAQRVIIPVYGSGYCGSFYDEIFKKWSLNYGAASALRDIDCVMNYFCGLSEYVSLAEAIENAFRNGSNKGESTYFEFTCHKKGTIHLTFKDEGIRRRFNICAAQNRGWLPGDYGAKPFNELPIDEQQAAESFEGKKNYTKHLGQPVFASKSLLQIAA